jgi:CelD/BcsL family acetyltransferase involved in cellulose biosynthesis
MSSKARRNIRREIRLLDEMAGGELRLSRITTPDQVEGFVASASHVSFRSWQRRVLAKGVRNDQRTLRKLEDLADRSLLRSYILQVGDTPCAFAIGYQHLSTYYFIQTGFDDEFKAYSPGKILLYLFLEDLHTHDSPRTLDFGVGDATYKRRFGNCEREDLSCLILPRNVRNKICTGTHSLFTSAVDVTKRIIGRRVTK